MSVPSPAGPTKATAVVAGMLAGADSIDDLDVLRHGGMAKAFTGVRAPSTLGTFLRSFTFGHVRQLDAVNARLTGSGRGPTAQIRVHHRSTNASRAVKVWSATPGSALLPCGVASP